MHVDGRGRPSLQGGDRKQSVNDAFGPSEEYGGFKEFNAAHFLFEKEVQDMLAEASNKIVKRSRSLLRL